MEEHKSAHRKRTELDRTIQVLCRAEKNNPLHIGEAGRSKTALVYGLAKLINETRSLNASGLTSMAWIWDRCLPGAHYRGDFEKHIKMVMEEP